MFIRKLLLASSQLILLCIVIEIPVYVWQELWTFSPKLGLLPYFALVCSYRFILGLWVYLLVYWFTLNFGGWVLLVVCSFLIFVTVKLVIAGAISLIFAVILGFVLMYIAYYIATYDEFPKVDFADWAFVPPSSSFRVIIRNILIMITASGLMLFSASIEYNWLEHSCSPLGLSSAFGALTTLDVQNMGVVNLGLLWLNSLQLSIALLNFLARDVTETSPTLYWKSVWCLVMFVITFLLAIIIQLIQHGNVDLAYILITFSTNTCILLALKRQFQWKYSNQTP